MVHFVNRSATFWVGAAGVWQFTWKAGLHWERERGSVLQVKAGASSQGRGGKPWTEGWQDTGRDRQTAQLVRIEVGKKEASLQLQIVLHAPSE